MTSPPPEIVPAVKMPLDFDRAELSEMAWSFVIGGLKGGLGKSTSAWLLAIELASLGRRVLVVCADPLSQTLTTAYRNALGNYEVPFHHIAWPTPENFVKGVEAEFHRVGATDVIVDVGGESAQILEQAVILVSKLASERDNMSSELIVPTAPTIPELWRLQSTFDAAAKVEGLCPEPPNVNLLVCKAAWNSSEGKEARQYFASRDWPVLRSQIPNKEFYRKCLRWVPEDGGWYRSVLAERAQDRVKEAAA